MEVPDVGSFTHIIAYDNSGSTSCCQVDYFENNVPKTARYFDFLKDQFMPKLINQFPSVEFKYIEWNSCAKITDCIVGDSDGGTDPTDAFSLVEEHFENYRKYIHFLTDGDIMSFNYDKLKVLSNNDKIDIHFLGNNNHNIEFYQTVKENLQERCNVFINGETVAVYEDVFDGELVISEEDQMAILTHNFKTEEKCAAFNKLLATVATHGRNETYKEAIRKTLAKMVQKSKGKLLSTIQIEFQLKNIFVRRKCGERNFERRHPDERNSRHCFKAEEKNYQKFRFRFFIHHVAIGEKPFQFECI